MSFEGKRAVVTGAAQGIGLAIADALAANGAEVVGVDIKGSEGRGKTVVADLSDTAALGGLAETIQNKFGPIDMLVNCAGICVTEPMLSSDPCTWERVFRVNTFAPFFLIQHFAKVWIDRGAGAALNIASVSGFVPKTEQTAYGASKAALISLTRSAAAVLGPHGIRVNAIAPGVIDTPLTSKIAEQRAAIREITPEETLAPVLVATPLGRIGTVDEVAELALFLLSDKAGYITGQTFGIDGGLLMR